MKFDFTMKDHEVISENAKTATGPDGLKGTTIYKSGSISETIEVTRWNNGDIEKDYLKGNERIKTEAYQAKSDTVTAVGPAPDGSGFLYEVYDNTSGKLMHLASYKGMTYNRDDKTSSSLKKHLIMTKFGDNIKQLIGLDTRDEHTRAADQKNKVLASVTKSMGAKR